MKDVKRFDFIALPGSIKRSDEGFIKADPVVTRTGIFSYRLADGTIRKEFRSDEEVFNADALASIQMIPITDTHPDDFVTPENAKELAIGMTGENARRDGSTVRVPIKITTESGVAAVEGGRLQLSLGYRCDVERKDGEFKGEKFTHVQSNIRCNHLALCKKARAGAQATLRLDADDAVMVQDAKKPRKEKQTMKGKVRLDSGVSYEVDAEVESAFDKMRKDGDDVAAKRDEHKADLDKLQAKHDALVEESEKLKKVDNDKAISEGVAARVKLLETVKPMLGEDDAKKADSMTDAELRIAGISSQVEKFDAEGKSEDYLAARFDGAVEKFKTDEAGKKKTGSTIVGDHSGHQDDETDLDAKRKDMMDKQDGKKPAKDKE